jgi:DNA-binding beta-propeller fold protein YncE
MDARTGEILRDWATVGKTSHMNNISEGGEWVYAINVASGNVAAIEVETGNTIVIEVGDEPQGSAFSKDGSKLFISCRDHVAVIDIKKLEVIDRIVPGSLRCAVTPDNITLITASTWKGIGFFDVETHKLMYHLQMPFQMFSLTLSRDGLYAFASAEPEEISYIISVKDRKVVFKFKTLPGSRPGPFYDF